MNTSKKLLTCGLGILAANEVLADEILKEVHIVEKGECFSRIVEAYRPHYPSFSYKNLYQKFQDKNPLENYDLIEIDQKILLPRPQLEITKRPEVILENEDEKNTSVSFIKKVEFSKSNDFPPSLIEADRKALGISNQQTKSVVRKTTKVSQNRNRVINKTKIAKSNTSRNPFLLISTYRVKMGQNLNQIAKELFPGENYKKIVKSILEINPEIKNPNQLSTGSILRIPELSEMNNIAVQVESLENSKPETYAKVEEQKSPYQKSKISKSTSLEENIQKIKKRKPSSLKISLNQKKASEKLEKEILKNIQKELRANSSKPVLYLSNVERSTYKSYLNNLLKLNSEEERIDELVFLKTLSKKLKHVELEARFLRLITDATKSSLSQEDKINFPNRVKEIIQEIES